MRIDSDRNRFKDIIKGKIKSDLKKFASSSDIIGQQGAKTIRIPIHNINIPRFTFGANDGVGSGIGDLGDAMGGEKGKSGSGPAGEDKGDHDFSAEFDPSELAEMMIEELKLPRLEPKGKGDVNSEKSKYNSISNQGPESLRHYKKTFKNALKRQISTGNYDPKNPMIIPEKNDKRYKHFTTKETPDINTVVFNIIDVSGSMEEEQKKLVKTISFWTDLLLKHSYKNIETVFIIHDTLAQEVNREQFFSVSSSGGTVISSAFELCSSIIKERYNFSDYNTYVFYYSDGDNRSSDNITCTSLLNDKLLPNCNMFAYGQVKSNNGSGEFLNYLNSNHINEKIITASIESDEDILKTIKLFFQGGK